MDFEEFYPISQAEYESIMIEKLRGISQFEVNPVQRNQLSNLKKIMDVGGVDERIYYRGYVDVWDVWDSNGQLYLRHRVLDSTN